MAISATENEDSIVVIIPKSDILNKFQDKKIKDIETFWMVVKDDIHQMVIDEMEDIREFIPDDVFIKE